MMAPPVRPDTPRIKFQFRHLDRTMRRAALGTIFEDLNASSLDDRRGVIHQIEKIVFLYQAFPKTNYKGGTSADRDKRATWVRAVNRHSTELAKLLRECPYGPKFIRNGFDLPTILDNLDALARGHNANAGKKRTGVNRKRPRNGFDWLIANLALFYTERTGQKAKYEEYGSFLRIIRSVCNLIGISEYIKTNEAIRKVIARLPDKSLPPPS